jgi:cyclohexanecarboxylate-CoA ligase
MWDTIRVPAPALTREYYDAGWWRHTTFLDDLARHAAERPDDTAVVAYESGALARAVTWADLDSTVHRYAAALTSLGVGRGDIVVLYLPNHWMLAALHLACNRIGAVSSPVIPEHGVRELTFVLTATGARVCVTVDSFEGVDFGARVAEAAPEGVCRVVAGDAAATGALDFGAVFEAAVPVDLPPPGAPDDPCLLIYTSGTTGQMKGVVHTPNTLYAAARSVSVPYRLDASDVIATPHFMTHMAGTAYAVMMPVMLGATSVVHDTGTDTVLQLDLLERHRVTWLYASPSYVHELIGTQTARARDTSALHRIVSGSAPVHPELVNRVRNAFGVPLHTLWGMTENGGVTVTRPDDPEGWGAHSDGRPEPWMQVRIDEGVNPDTDEVVPTEPGAGRLLVRGASQCLGYFGRPDVYDACVDADGWFDTGDLARDDGRGGIRITGRRADLIIRRDGMKVPTLEVEAVLARMDSIASVVLIGYPDPDVAGTELVCAVVVPAGTPPVLSELRDYLRAEGMTPIRWPDRIECVEAMPVNSLGKVLRPHLRAHLESLDLPVGA